MHLVLNAGISKGLLALDDSVVVVSLFHFLLHSSIDFVLPEEELETPYISSIGA